MNEVARVLRPEGLVLITVPAYPWLFERTLDGADTAAKLAALRRVGVPYTEDDIASAQSAVEGRTESDALIAYLQSLGAEVSEWSGES